LGLRRRNLSRHLSQYSFQEIRTPLFESTELFARATGESSDVMVTKQMYSFVAPDEQSYTLRPEGTAGVVRAYLEHNLSARGPVSKLFYLASVFRYEAPQAGRYRQHHQCGIEMLGASGPEADAEVLALSHEFLRALGIEPTLKINSLGTPQSRREYLSLLRAFWSRTRRFIARFAETTGFQCATGFRFKRPTRSPRFAGRAATSGFLART
jgi:histidyl-tRNA synthetase